MKAPGRRLESLAELYAAELDDLYALALLQTDVLSRISEAAESQELAGFAREQASTERGQLVNLEELFEALGRQPAYGGRDSTAALGREALEATELAGAGTARDAAMLGALRRMKQAEMATCSALTGMARALGNGDAETALIEICRAAGQMDAGIERLAGPIHSAAVASRRDVTVL